MNSVYYQVRSELEKLKKVVKEGIFISTRICVQENKISQGRVTCVNR